MDDTVFVPWNEIDLSADLSWALPADPALVAFMQEQSSGRLDVEDEVSASQLENGDRRLFLESSVDYFVDPVSQIALIMGTLKHSMVNIERPGFVNETRLFYDLCGIRIASAKCDTYHVPRRRLVDLKAIKWYAIKRMLTDGILKAKPGYVYQLNLFRVLMKQPANQELLRAKYPWLTDEDFDVQSMQLTCIPPDMNWLNKKEALKLVSHAEIIPIVVPFLDDEQVLSAYEEKYLKKKEALEKQWAPICTAEERWEKEGGYPLNCAKFCPVLDACRELSAEHGEKHPLDEWEAGNERRAEERAEAKPAALPVKNKKRVVRTPIVPDILQQSFEHQISPQ
jgi:hypothetical protein